MTNVYFALFASNNFRRQQVAQIEELMRLGVSLDRIYKFSPEDLGDKFYSLIPYANQENQFGNFSFKPFFLDKILSTLPIGSLLVYLDANDKPLEGLENYASEIMARNQGLNIVCAATNYSNSRRTSWFHARRSSIFLAALSSMFCQPEAGALILRKNFESEGLLKAWFALTRMHSQALQVKPDLNSRHDQETLFQLSVLNNSIYFEPYWRYRLFRKGFRKFIAWEYFR